jgi:hypothetical protein
MITSWIKYLHNKYKTNLIMQMNFPTWKYSPDKWLCTVNLTVFIIILFKGRINDAMQTSLLFGKNDRCKNNVKPRVFNSSCQNTPQFTSQCYGTYNSLFLPLFLTVGKGQCSVIVVFLISRFAAVRRLSIRYWHCPTPHLTSRSLLRPPQPLPAISRQSSPLKKTPSAFILVTG